MHILFQLATAFMGCQAVESCHYTQVASGACELCVLAFHRPQCFFFVTRGRPIAPIALTFSCGTDDCGAFNIYTPTTFAPGRIILDVLAPFSLQFYRPVWRHSFVPTVRIGRAAAFIQSHWGWHAFGLVSRGVPLDCDMVVARSTEVLNTAPLCYPHFALPRVPLSLALIASWRVA